MTQKISLISQMAAVQAAPEGKEFLPRSAQEKLQKDHLTAALETLRWLKANETDVRQMIEVRKGGRA